VVVLLVVEPDIEPLAGGVVVVVVDESAGGVVAVAEASAAGGVVAVAESAAGVVVEVVVVVSVAAGVSSVFFWQAARLRAITPAAATVRMRSFIDLGSPWGQIPRLPDPTQVRAFSKS